MSQIWPDKVDRSILVLDPPHPMSDYLPWRDVFRDLEYKRLEPIDTVGTNKWATATVHFSAIEGNEIGEIRLYVLTPDLTGHVDKWEHDNCRTLQKIIHAEVGREFGMDLLIQDRSEMERLFITILGLIAGRWIDDESVKPMGWDPRYQVMTDEDYELYKNQIIDTVDDWYKTREKDFPERW